MNDDYAKKVEILLRMIPIVTEKGVFAVHGGSAINLFVRNLPRYSVDIDLTYIPLEDRTSSLVHITEHLRAIAGKAREGLLFCLLGSDRPIHESFAPSLIDQRDALANQFVGMTDIDFSYNDFEQTRMRLIADVNALMTSQDKSFLLCFESAEPEWGKFDFAYFQDYPSITWKLQNLLKLKDRNHAKLK